MDTQLLLKTAMLAGEIMLRSGAETYRVEDTMHHILKTADHIEMAEVLVIMTGISATIKLENEKAVTVTKRVEERDTNLKLVVDVNEISRQYCGDDLTLEQAYEKLSMLKQFEFSRKTTNLAMMGVGVGFTIFFGGSIADTGAAIVVGLFLVAFVSAGQDLKFHPFIQDIFAGFGVAFACYLLKEGLGDQMNMDTVRKFHASCTGNGNHQCCQGYLAGGLSFRWCKSDGSFLKSTWDCNWNWYWAGALHKDFLAGRRVKNEQYCF